MIDLLKDNQHQIADLCRQYGIRKVDVFGSATSGEFDAETSDVDFIADLGDLSQGSPWRYFHFADALEALLGRSVDLVSESAVRNPYFLAEVNETRQPIFAETGTSSLVANVPPPHLRDDSDTMPRRLAGHLWIAQQSATSLESFVRDRTLADYLNDEMLRAAVERELQILGAALDRARRSDPTLEVRISTIPTWMALQERIDLTYENINAKRMWSILSRHLDSVVEDLDVVMLDAPPVEGAATKEGGMSGDSQVRQ
jgi:predicted nucleotidyltransferase/uncharacterized protein with HEPN domain